MAEDDGKPKSAEAGQQADRTPGAGLNVPIAEAEGRDREVEDEAPRDGRVARAVRTRRAVADALLNLIAEGDLRPTSKAIAERAGVSERTIFQHFEDLETLFSAAASRVGDRIIANLKHVPSDGPFEERLRLYMDELVYLHEATTPVRRASRLHEPFSPVLDNALSWLRNTLRRGLERVFSIELASVADDAARTRVLESLSVMASWSSWENLRGYNGLSKDEARLIVTESLRALLRQPSVDEPAPAAGSTD